MAQFSDVVVLLSNRIVRDVFEKIVQKRSVLFKDLLGEIAAIAAVSARKMVGPNDTACHPLLTKVSACRVVLRQQH